MNYKKIALGLLIIFAVASSLSYGVFMDKRHSDLMETIKWHEDIPDYVKEELTR